MKPGGVGDGAGRPSGGGGGAARGAAVVVWVHGDNLNPGGPALRAYPGAPALFVWDDPLLSEMAISLKRIVFIYESLLELPVVIRRGDVAAEVARFAAEYGATRVVTAASVSPRFRAIAERLQEEGLDVIELAAPPFFEPEEPLDLQRFSRFWRVARRYL